MKKLAAICLAVVLGAGLAACAPKEQAVDNQLLTLVCELNGKTHTYNIEYDADNKIVRVDNTDYYEFLKEGELITDVGVLDTELTDYFVKNGGSAKVKQ